MKQSKMNDYGLKIDNLSTTLNKIINDQNDELSFKKEKIYATREALASLIEYTNNDISLIKVIIGARRVGKSTLCYQILKDKKFIYFNFDDDRLSSFTFRHFDLLWEKLLKFYGDTPYVFFDEIQNIKKWDLFLNRLQRLGYNIWITGSNANLLSKELSTYLTGRCIEFELYPFSFREYLDFQGINSALYNKKGAKGRSEVGRAFDLYFVQGGFPEVLKIKDWKPYLRGLFSQIIARDIAQRYPRTEIALINEFAIRIVNYAGCRMSFQELSRQIEGSSAATLIRYMKYIESVYLCFSVPNFNIKKKAIDKVPKKLFTLDLGLIETLSTKMTQDFGLKLENLVFIELKRRKLSVFSWKGHHGEEIDFLIYENRKVKELIQVCWDISDPRTLQRELRAFELAYSDFGHHQPKLTLLTHEQEGLWEFPVNFKNQRKKIQIKAYPIAAWLLE